LIKKKKLCSKCRSEQKRSCPDPLWGSPTSIQWVPGSLSMGVNGQGREADHSPPSSAEVKNAWSYTSNPQHVFMS